MLGNYRNIRFEYVHTKILEKQLNGKQLFICCDDGNYMARHGGPNLEILDVEVLKEH